MNKAILFSQRRWSAEGVWAIDTIEEYVKLLKTQGAVLWPQLKIGKINASEKPFQHKDIKTGYIYSSKFRSSIDSINEVYYGKVGWKIDIKWIKGGEELTKEHKKLIMKKKDGIPLYNDDEYFTSKLFWMCVEKIIEIEPPMAVTEFVGYNTGKFLERQPIQYVFVVDIF